MGNKWEIVVFYKGKRKEIPWPHDAKTAIEQVIPELEEKGAKAHLVSRRRAFAPKHPQPPADHPDWLWCPYCRRYREFVVPRGREDGPIIDDEGKITTIGYFTVCARSEIRVCLWCSHSVFEFYVRLYNPDLWTDATRRRRSKRKKRRGQLSRA